MLAASGMWRAYVRKLARAVRRRGVAETARIALDFAANKLQSLSPERRRARKLVAAKDAQFDRERGVETTGCVSIATLDGIVGAAVHADDASAYQPADPDALRAILVGLRIEYPEYTFLDFGCGKGRALLVAAELPFRRVVGVEFAPALYEVAARNLSSDRGPRRCPEVQVELGDAAEFSIPDGPLIVFMFNPFGEQVMDPVLQNLAKSRRESTQDLQIIYWNPRLAAMVEAHGFVRLDGSSDLPLDGYARFAVRPPP